MMKNQQKILGILCILLPILAVGFGLIGYFRGVNEPGWYESISATYYANSRMMMIGLLFASGIYFWAYRGYDKADMIITSISAAMAFCVVAFPCSDGRATSEEIVGLLSLPTNVSGTLHLVAAISLYATFIIQIVRFTKSGGTKTKMKKIRNIVYWTCFGLMCLGFALVALVAFSVVKMHWFVLLGESFLQLAYGVSWLTKAGCIKFLND